MSTPTSRGYVGSALNLVDEAQRLIQSKSGPELALSLSYKLDQIRAELRRAEASGRYVQPGHWPREAWTSLIERFLSEQPSMVGQRVALFLLTDEEQAALEAHRGV